MVGNSKVLTVSYGTFSCTLEGFDDSFDTMKAIAEYFRDLAAEDRYFGAEPPQPDAEVLARIAQRELSRSVEARADGNAVLLKPIEAETPEAATDAPVEEAPTEKPAVEDVPIEKPIEDHVGEEDRDEVEETTPAAAQEHEERLEALGEEEAPASIDREDEDTLAAEAASETGAELTEAPFTQVVPEEVDGLETLDVQDAPVEEEVEEPEAEAEAGLPVAEEPEEPDAAAFFGEAEEEEFEPFGEDGSFEEEASGAEQENAFEDEAGAFFEMASEELAVEEPAGELIAEDVEPKVEDVAPEAEEKPADNSLAAKLRRIQAVVGAASASVAARAAAAKPSSEYIEDEHAEDFSQASDAPAEEAASAGVSASGDVPAREEEGAEDIQNVNANRPRVMKVRRADFEAAMASAQTEEHEDYLSGDDEEVTSIFAETEVADAADEAHLESTLSPEDEADLIAELAAAEAEARAEDADATQDSTEEEVSEQPEEETSKRSFEDSDAAMSRLMDETDAKLDDPENKTRREAYSHLKAAVAAKQASRDMGEEEGETAKKREGDYRADLAKVVRPRRAAKAETSERTERPAPAPLKLVASQRVDQPQEDAPKSAEPVRPRRVAKQAEETNTSAFASFASSAGAQELPDVIEAAASYVTHVQGQEVFSRPQVMRVVQQALPNGSFTREDGLRAFGTLLRQSRLNKIRGGQFEITETTGFQPQARDLRAAV